MSSPRKRKGTGSGSNGSSSSGRHKLPEQTFDPLQFRIRSKDDAGHYEKIQTQIPPELDVEIKRLVSSNRFDFDGIGGFVRWACVNGLEFLKAVHPEYPSQISIIRSINLEDAQSEVRREFRKSIEHTAREAFELAGMGYTVEAAKHVHRILGEVRKLDPRDPWREIYRSEITQKFGHLLRSGKAASLIPALDSTDVDELTQMEVM